MDFNDKLDSIFEKKDPCWKGYEQYGMKDGDNGEVPNCVPKKKKKKVEEKKVDKDKMDCNKISRDTGGNKKFKVKACKDGEEKIVRFGDPNMEIRRDDPKRRKAFRDRHSCDEKKDKFSAGYWSCKQWRAGSKVED
jgi:hypothetical protein